MSFGKQHHYSLTVTWTGNTGTGTSTYRGYERAHDISADNKPAIEASSDASFHGDRQRWNPEELLLAALASCHQLAYLHLCAVAGIVVTAYQDHAEGWMRETEDGGGQFTRVMLRPAVTISSGDQEKARNLHHEAHKICFIARSVNFPVENEPQILLAAGA